MGRSSPAWIFNFDEHIQYVYSHGQCWYLALALELKTGCPVIALWADGSIHHVGIVLPRGEIVDIEGVWLSKNWITDWGYELDFLPDVHIGPVSEQDSHWFVAKQNFDESMLDATPVGEYTLGEVSDIIVDILKLKNLL